MSNEAKVGAFTICGIALIVAVLIGINDFKIFSAESYKLYISFSQVTGLNPGAQVKFAGVDAGTVKTVEADGMAALVSVEVKPDIHIPRGSRITIAQDGLLAEKFIGVTPSADNGDYYQDGDYIKGTDEKSMDSMMAQVNDTLGQVHQLLTSMNNVFGSKETQKSMIESAMNLQKLTGALAEMAQGNKAEVSAMAHNLNLMSQNLAGTTAEVNALVAGFSGDGETARNLRIAVANLTETSARIDNMAKSIESVATDPTVANDIKETLHNTKEVTYKANKMLGGLSGGHFEAGIDTMYSGMDSNWAMNADMRLYPTNDKFLLFGVDDIGEENDVNLQVGKTGGALTARAGIVDSEVGMGLDADAGPLRFTVEAYDLNDAHLKGRVRYRVKDDTYLFSQINDMTNRDHRATYFGIRQEF